MQIALIDIGTSKGIRIPATVLKTFHSLMAFDLKVEGNRIVLDVVEKPRAGWEDKFKNTKNSLLIDETLDIKEWDDL